MPSKFLESFTSTHFTTASVEKIQSEFTQWTNLAVSQGTNQQTETKNKLRLIEIKLHFARANKLFNTKKFQEALKTYQLVHGLVFRLLYPGFKIEMVSDLKYIPVTDAALFEPLLTVGTEMAVSLMSQKTTGDLSYINFRSLPDNVQEYAKTFDELGATTVDQDIPNDVNNAAILGLEYAKNKDWENAEKFFKVGLEGLSNATTTDGKIAKASMELNIAAIYIQTGEFVLANRYLKLAGEGFKANNDTIGEAQTQLNLAAVSNKNGDATRAAELSKNAENLLEAKDKFRGRIQPVPNPGRDIIKPPADRADNLIKPSTGYAANMPFASLSENGTSVKSDVILELAAKKGDGVLFRMPGQGEGWLTQELQGNIEKTQRVATKELGILIDGSVTKFKWTQGKGVELEEVKKNYFAKRVDSVELSAVNLGYELSSDLAVNLPRFYLYQLPVCIGDCYHHLGQFDKALANFKTASNYKYINTNIELRSIWTKIARNYLGWGNSLFKQQEVSKAAEIYVNVILENDKVPVNSPLFEGKLGNYGSEVASFINTSLAEPGNSSLNPTVSGLVMNVRNKLKMIKTGLDYFGNPTNYYPIFKFDYLQSVATYFSQQAIQAEREYINFISRAEDEEMTREQLEQSVEMGNEQIKLAEKQVEYADQELQINKENLVLAEVRLGNALKQRDEYEEISHDIIALDAAMAFASGPEGYAVVVTYYSQVEGKEVTLYGADAYRFMYDAAWKKGLLTRDMELANMNRNILELEANKSLAQAQVAAAVINLELAEEQLKIAQLNAKQAQDLLDGFESQIFTPEIWFQLGNTIRFISDNYLNRAIGVAKKMQRAYELETGRLLSSIKNDYHTNIISGLLSADYLLNDINYFTIDRINNSKSKDIPIKQIFSLFALNPMGFQTTFKNTGTFEFETSLTGFDAAYPGSYLRKIKKVEVIVEGLLPPGGVHGTLKNSGISRDRKKNSDEFFRIQPFETMFISDYNPRQDIAIFQPDQRVLDVFENCGVATGWTIDIPVSTNDVNYQTISDIKMIVYYTAQFDTLLENKIKATLPATGEKSTVFPLRMNFPDEYYNFVDSGVLKFEIISNDFPYNETNLLIKNVSFRIATDGVPLNGFNFTVKQGAEIVDVTTDDSGTIKSNNLVNGTKMNVFIGQPVSTEWSVTLSETNNPGLDRSKIRDIFFFVEYSFNYKGR